MIDAATLLRLAALGVLALVVAGCDAGAQPRGADGAVQVIATTPHVGDIARQVGGDRVHVVQLLQPGSDPHDYEPRPDDVKAVAQADVVLASGLELDHWIEEVVRSAGSEATVIHLGDRVPVRLRGGDHGPFDPHWWHEPRNVQAAAREVAKAFGDGALADRYVAEVERVTGAIRSCLAKVPAERRKLVTDHDAFAYFARAYGITVVGAVIPSTTSKAQASAGELSRLADTIEREHVRAVFPESGLNADLAEAIARRTGATVGGALYADALAPAGSPAGTLLGAEAANADALVKGFTGRAEGCGIRA